MVFDREFSSSAMEIEPRHAEVFALADGTRTVDQILFACHQGPRAAAAALRALVDRGLVRRTAVRIVKGGVPVVPDIVRTVVAPGTPVTIFGIFQAREIQRPRVGKLLSHEPLLTAKLLKLLTLGNMRLERSDLSINRLVERLGSFQTRCLLLPEAVRNLHYPQEEFYWRECWQHDQMCAQLCEQIARKTNYPYPGEAFLAGLLHNIGVYLLMSANPRAYRCLAMESLTRQVHMEDIEEKHFGISHTRIGGVYAKKWQFPPALRMAIREHHTADTSAGRTLAHILHVAEAIAQQLGCRVGFTPIDRRRFRDALATLGLNDKVLVSLVAAHQRKIMEPILEIIKPAG